MAEFCINSLPAGINADCTKPLAPVRMVAIAAKGTSFASDSAFVNKTVWEGKVKTLAIFAPASIASYENTTDEPTINTSATGKKYLVSRSVPSMRVFFDANVCDYNEMAAKLKGGIYSVFLILEDGTLMGRRTSTGTVEGFTARINATGTGVPIPDAIENSYPVYINFQSAQEFESRVAKSPVGWNPLMDIPAAMPIGLSITALSAYTTGDITVKIAERCGDPYNDSGLAAGDFEILGSNDLTSPAVTGVVTTGSATGTYVLTVEKGSTPVSLAAGDYVILRVKVLDSTNVTHISSDFVVQG